MIRCRKCKTDKPTEAFAKNRSYKTGYQHWCKVCYKQWDKDHPRRREGYNAKWRKRRIHIARAGYIRKNRRLRAQALDAIGQKSCACCGEFRATMLDIDHKFNDGKQDRDLRGGSMGVFRHIARCGNLDGRYQVLCCNCNHSKRRNNGTCEHESEAAEQFLCA